MNMNRELNAFEAGRETRKRKRERAREREMNTFANR
jgi:hypothetical protein